MKDPQTTYLFVTPSFSNNSVQGYIPRGRNVGFVSNVGAIAHELGHGAFGLEHSFDKNPASKNNLMDYGGGSFLTQAQWKKIQNPGVIINWFDDAEDAMFTPLLIYALKKGGECLTASMVDFALQYYIEGSILKYQGKVDDFTDWKPIWAEVDGIQMASACGSALVKCASCGVFIGAAEGIGRELYTQVITENKPIVIVQWGDLAQKGLIGGVAGYLGFIAIGLLLNGSANKSLRAAIGLYNGKAGPKRYGLPPV